MHRTLTTAIAALGVLFSLNALATPQAPRIEVAFAMDATGSMGPYIVSARKRIESIAQALAMGTPTPDIRFGLVAFRDRGDEFVTRVSPFTPKLERMKQYLDSTKAAGGGDTPEAVLEAVSEAISKLDWSPRSDDASVVRLLYLVGDAPAQHYPDGPSESGVAAAARHHGIVIQSIACGSASQLEPTFEKLARYTEGQFFRLNDRKSTLKNIMGERSTPATDLASTLTNTTRAYSSSVGVAYAEGSADPVESTPLFGSTASSDLGTESGLSGAHMRWVTDGETWAAIWRAHVSKLPVASQPPVPDVDFTQHHVLALGGAQSSVELERVEQREGERFALAHIAHKNGVSFYLIPAKGTEQ